MLSESASYFLGNGPQETKSPSIIRGEELASDYLYIAHKNHFKVYRLMERLVTWNKTFTAVKIVRDSLSPHATGFCSCFFLLAIGLRANGFA